MHTKEELKEKAFEIYKAKDIDASEAYDLAYDFLSVNRDKYNRVINTPISVRVEVRGTLGVVDNVAYFWYIKEGDTKETLLGRFITRYDNEYNVLQDSGDKRKVLSMLNETIDTKVSIYEDVNLTKLRIAP